MGPQQSCMQRRKHLKTCQQCTDDVSFENLKNAVIYGSTLASFCVEKFGTKRMEELKKTEVYHRLQEFKNLTQFEIELS